VCVFECVCVWRGGGGRSTDFECVCVCLSVCVCGGGGAVDPLLAVHVQQQNTLIVGNTPLGVVSFRLGSIFFFFFPFRLGSTLIQSIR